IDEFQDTSESQWMNLLPLVVNSLGSGFMSLVVGDAKQSIYRWRGGDLRLLLEGIEKHLQPFKELISSTPLSTNYRSKKAIVDFNNSIFKRVCDVIATIEGLNDLSTLRLAYGKDVEQLVAEKNGKGGYVEVRFIEQEKKVSPSEKAELQLTLETIQDLLSRGYRYRDITILVRKKKEGNQVAKFLFDNGINKVISPDSLLIEGSSKVRFIINLFRLLADPGNAVARSQALHYYMIAQGG
ncbi:MAG: UvrD-helicase domain-containing protein, partial [Flavobacteriales bacterium]